MDERFLLYIDILGFAEMAKRSPRKVARIYTIMDSLNAHKHRGFKTIVFSDTVLIYNPELAVTDEDRSYYVWYLTEFAEDLQHRLTGQDIYFRAVLTTGDFNHYPLKNIECFFGEALVNAYRAEKAIPSIGLFLDERCAKYNEYFRTATFDSDYQFVYLTRSLEDLNVYVGAKYPTGEAHLGEQTPYVPWQVRFLKDVHTAMRVHPDPAVRTKFLTAWDFYDQRYPAMLHALVENDFALSALASRSAWIEESAAMMKSVKHFKRIGSGTPLSLGITGRKRRRSNS